MILKDTKLKNKLKKLLDQYPEVIDVVVFGSVVRGKKKPSDIDILVLFKTKVLKQVEYKIRKTIEQTYETVSIISKTEKTLLDSSFDARESYLFEGVSFITKNTLFR